MPEDKRPKNMQENCRHRFKHQPPPTPEHYWDVDFPTTQQCIERGYGGAIAQSKKADEEAAAKRPRRKRPLMLNTKKTDEKSGDQDTLEFGDL